MKIKRQQCLVLGIFMLWGCVSAPVLETEDSKTESSDNIVVIPVFYANETEKELNISYYLSIEERESKKFIGEFEIPLKDGYMVIDSLSPGEYAITGANIHSISSEGSGIATLAKKYDSEDMYHPFSVIENAISSAETIYRTHFFMTKDLNPPMPYAQLQWQKNEGSSQIKAIKQFISDFPSYSRMVEGNLLIGIETDDKGRVTKSRYWNVEDNTIVNTIPTTIVTVTGSSN